MLLGRWPEGAKGGAVYICRPTTRTLIVIRPLIPGRGECLRPGSKAAPRVREVSRKLQGQKKKHRKVCENQKINQKTYTRHGAGGGARRRRGDQDRGRREETGPPTFRARGGRGARPAARPAACPMAWKAAGVGSHAVEATDRISLKLGRDGGSPGSAGRSWGAPCGA